MATRVSGTRSLPPQSGIVSGGGVSGSVTQTDDGRVVVNSTGNTNLDSPITKVTGLLDVTNTTAATDPTNGAVHISGGLGVEGDVRVGGFIYGRIAQANSATTSTAIAVVPTNEDKVFYPLFTDQYGLQNNGSIIYADNHDYNNSLGGLTYNAATGKFTTEQLAVKSPIESTSTTTGALTVNGGLGVGGNINVHGNISPADDLLSNLGALDKRWSDAFLDNIYAKTLTSLGNDNISLAPAGGVADIFGDIRVRGKNPIGTAPVVTSVLYVTMDGDDTNDGRAMDPSRACRTISGAVNSPYYQSGTQIRVSPGLYLENNPIRLKPYTSVVGSDLRTCSVEPINKTQDLFHLDSGCYLGFMQFLNGRSGLLPGAYASGYNRGAYATAFPPLTGDDRINLFHSPYVQNCTNQTGPWLKDGTMFVPDQTVQVPLAVGTSTWSANTTSLIVTVSTGTIVRGMKINTGKQNPGFFNARTLLLANKPFLQEQVVTYIDNLINQNIANPGSIWYGFDYSREFCFRDVGILVENVSYDAAFGGNEKSVESGRAYYRGTVSLIHGQEQQTTIAINYLRDLCQQITVNTVCTDLLSGTGKYHQVINTVLTDGDVVNSSLSNLFGIITDIISNSDVTYTSYIGQSPDAAFISAETLLQANRTFIQENTLNYINWNLVQPQPVGYLPYNKIKCRRDTKIIVDSIAQDLLHTTSSQITFAGLQYWNQDAYVPNIADELTTTTNAVTYLRDLSVKIIQNITTSTDLVPRYNTYASVQDTASHQAATTNEAGILVSNFNIIISILKGNKRGWTDKVIPNGDPSELPAVNNAYSKLLDNLNNNYIQDEVISYIESTKTPGFTYDQTICRRDIGYIVKSIAFDLLHGGNRQSIQSGLSYYGYNGSSIVIPQERVQTVNAFTFLSQTIGAMLVTADPLPNPLQSKVLQVVGLPLATGAEQTLVSDKTNILNDIITNGPGSYEPNPINLATSAVSTVINAANIIRANREFLVAEVLAYLDKTYNQNVFSYDQDLCYRDTGLIVDAVSQDIVLGGNHKSIEAGLAYWNKGYSYVSEQLTTTTAAINYIASISKKIIANQSVDIVTGTYATQVINPFFQYGDDYMPQEAVARNFKIITDILDGGPGAAPIVYAGGGLAPLTGINGADVKLAPVVTSVDSLGSNVYQIGLDIYTSGFGDHSTLYFGDTYVQPLQDPAVESLSIQYTGTATTWAERKLDPIGGMGGSLVDGAVISDISPIQSFVYDAYTQVTQGGRGIYITNNGYAQLVSVFTIFCSVGVQVDNGGIASITNSNCNFGDLSLVSKGYGKREFSGTVYNPIYTAYPNTPGPDGFNQYYPNGYWPNRGTVELFIPDTVDRPHISLVMEVVPPQQVYDAATASYIDQVNEQGFPGFLNSSPSTGTLTTGTITLVDIDTSGIAIGNAVYIRDQLGRDHDSNGVKYVATGTVVSDINYNAITLSKALTSGGGDITNPVYFTLYFCGNAYYTVLSSSIAANPKPENVNILSEAGLQYRDPFTNQLIEPPSQVAAHVSAIEYLRSLVDNVVSNTAVPTPYQTTISQKFGSPGIDGTNALNFIDQGFQNLINIVQAPNIAAAKTVVPSTAVKKKGTIPTDGGDAITLITDNLDFLTEETVAYVDSTLVGFIYNSAKCARDVGLIVDAVAQDLLFSGTSQTDFAGIQYWNHGTRVGAIDQELTTTTNTINYVKDLAKKVIVGDTSGIRHQSAVSQVTNLPYATASEINAIGTDFNVITGILTYGVQSVTDNIVPNGIYASANNNIIHAYDLLQANRAYLQAEAIAYVEDTKTLGFTYDQTKCSRDVGYIVDSVSFDLLYGGNRQAIQSGVYYWGYNASSTALPGEVTQSTAAYEYLKSILSNIITGTAITTPYQNVVSQVTAGNHGSGQVTTDAQTLIENIVQIINNGPSLVTSKTPIGLTETTDADYLHAAEMIHANRDFLKAEIVAFVDVTYVNSGVGRYNRNKCARDVRLILQRLIYDIESGGTYNMVMNGLSYWSRSGTHHIVELGEAVTNTSLFPDGATVNFYQRSYISASGYLFEYVGAGTNYGALPQVGRADPVQSKETVQLNNGAVFFTSTDQNGDFRIGPGLVISQATGVLSGRTFTKSLFANMTPFILAIEGR